jgi:tetratricopeptide (TPR) repeat protein
MKKIALITLGLIVSVATFGQQKPNYGATPADSVTCIESLIYKDYLTSDKALALELWRTAYRVCPGSQKTLYINGSKIYRGLFAAEKDEAKKALLVDTLLSIYDQRIEYFGQRGVVLGQKGQMMLKYTPKEYEKIFNTLNEAMTLTGNKTQAGVLVGMMYNMVNMEKKGLKTKAEVVEMYAKTLAICAANKNNAKGAEKYASAEKKINGVVGAYLNCDVLVPLAEKDFEANKENVDWLRRTMVLLKRKKCMKETIYATVAETYIVIEPTAAGYDGLGKLAQFNKQYAKAVGFFKKAIEMGETNDEKAEYNMSIAETYLSSRQYSSAKTYALKAAGLKSGWGEPYILIGDAYLSSSKTCDDGKLGKFGVFWAAVDKYAKAKSVDASVAGKANKKIAKASSYYPVTKDVFFYGKAKGDPYKVGCWINENTKIRTK